MRLKILQFLFLNLYAFSLGFTQSAGKDNNGKNNPNNWQTAKYSATYSFFDTYHNSGENSSAARLFKLISQDPIAKRQTDFDFNTTRDFHRFGFYSETNRIVEGVIEATIKRKTNNPNRFINFVDFKIGVGFTQHTCNLNMFGDSISGDTMVYEFVNEYHMRANTAKLTFALQFNTPQIIDFLSLYAGVQGYVGTVYDMSSSAGSSVLKMSSLRANTNPTSQHFNVGHQSFTKPSLITGINFPIGVSISLSRSIGIQFGFTSSLNYYYAKTMKSGSSYYGLHFSLYSVIN